MKLPYIPINSHKIFTTCFFIFSAFLIICCSGNDCNEITVNKEPVIIPDYSNITVPQNIAPINFYIAEEGKRYRVVIKSSKGTQIIVKSFDNKIIIPIGRWKKLIKEAAGGELIFDISVRKNKSWIKYKSIINHVAAEPIDSYVVYRLIHPGFEMWSRMGIYQRCLENFKELPVMVNTLSQNNCINCHSFLKNESHTMLFHMRGNMGGTVIYRNREIKKVNTKTDEIISAGVYPSWHPSGRYVTFSVNKIMQVFHAVPDKRIEVIDTLSDLIIYDTESNIVYQCESIASKERFETFPYWSPDGKYLYFCSAKALDKSRYNEIRYDLLRISFNPETRRFGNVDTIISSSKTGKSISFPVVSPDGRYILFCMSEYGNFTIWHNDSDLYLLDIENNEIIRPAINSNKSESYHSWSSNGRWIIFASRRDDGLFTRLWIAYFSSDRQFGKPFTLPQKNPEHNESFLKSYNRPELIRTKLDLHPRKLFKHIKKDPLPSTFSLCN